MLTTTAMCTRIRVADGKNTTTAVGTAYRTPDRHSRSMPNSRRASGVISAPLPPLGAREAGAAALAVDSAGFAEGSGGRSTAECRVTRIEWTSGLFRISIFGFRILVRRFVA